MALVREFAARTLVVLAMVALSAALGTWWSSLLLVRTAGTLTAIVETNASHAITAQLDRLAPGTAQLPRVQRDITKALGDPRVTQALAGSVSGGSASLNTELARLDTNLTPLLAQKPLVLDVGQHGVARLAGRLRALAKAALLAGLVLAGAALLLSPTRHLVLRYLAFAAAAIGAGRWLSVGRCLPSSVVSAAAARIASPRRSFREESRCVRWCSSAWLVACLSLSQPTCSNCSVDPNWPARFP